MINDEQLLLYHYDDGLSAPERAHIRARLRTDADLAARYQRLRDQLAVAGAHSGSARRCGAGPLARQSDPGRPGRR